MKMMTALSATALTLASATTAFANAAGCAATGTCTQVPEINAYAGVAAVAVLAAVVALIWERRRAA